MKSLSKVLVGLLVVIASVAIAKSISSSSELQARETTPAQGEIYIGALVRDYDRTLPLFLRSIEKQDYNKALLTLRFTICSDDESYKTSQALISNWIAKNGARYKSVSLTENRARYNEAMNEKDRRIAYGQIEEDFLKNSASGDYSHCLILSSENFIAPKTLSSLVQKDKPIIAPLLRPTPQAHDPYRNFFPDVTEKGYFKLNAEYEPIATRSKMGSFKVPCVIGVYLIKADVLHKLSFVDNFSDWEFITFSNNARQADVDQYICNDKEYGFTLHFPGDDEKENRKRFDLAGVDAEVTPKMLKTIFSPYYAEDPSLKAIVENFNFDDYALFRVNNRDLYYVDDVNDYIKMRVIKCCATWEEYIHDLFKKYVKPGSVALDIGGHIGTHTLNLSRLVGDTGTVYVFEPQHKMFCELAINMHLNERKNIKYFHNALGAEEKWIKMHIPEEQWTLRFGPTCINEGHGTVTLDLESSGDPTKMIRLDDLGIDGISLIKMDVEGFEMEVIKGGKDTILRNKPVMIVEIFTDDKTAERLKEIESLGYTTRYIGVDNYLFLPKEPI